MPVWPEHAAAGGKGKIRENFPLLVPLRLLWLRDSVCRTDAARSSHVPHEEETMHIEPGFIAPAKLVLANTAAAHSAVINGSL